LEAATLTRAPSLPVRRIRRAGLRRRADLAIVADYILELSGRHGPGTSRRPADPVRERLG
jgi:hypothetical protein